MTRRAEKRDPDKPIAMTIRLDPDTYQFIQILGSKYRPRRSFQDMVEGWIAREKRQSERERVGGRNG